MGLNCGGISFAVNAQFIKDHDLKFHPGIHEDRKFFKECLDKGKCLITYDPLYLTTGGHQWGGGSSQILYNPVTLL